MKLSRAVLASSTTLFHLSNPKLWWPNGYGDPNLYKLCWRKRPAGFHPHGLLHLCEDRHLIFGSESEDATPYQLALLARGHLDVVRDLAGVLAAACAAVLLPVALFAQNTSSRLSGAVTDPTGAAIANGTVVITNELTKADVFSGHTDASGNFTALELQAGRYRVTVEASGFKKTVLSGIVLDLAQAQELPVTLQVGTSDSTVNVNSSEQPQLENGTTAVSTVIDSQQVATLPLPNRDITQLIALAPGVVQGGDPTAFSTSQLSINGSRTLNSEFLLDGSSVINGSTGNVNRLPSPDFISEFRIIASTAPAEYGRTSGAVITAVTRSGTSDLHGTVYELLQNSNLNANSYFNKLPTIPLPRAKDDYNQFGFALGGPVYIPHFYTNRKKAFFFLNYDQTIKPDRRHLHSDDTRRSYISRKLHGHGRYDL